MNFILIPCFNSLSLRFSYVKLNIKILKCSEPADSQRYKNLFRKGGLSYFTDFTAQHYGFSFEFSERIISHKVSHTFLASNPCD